MGYDSFNPQWVQVEKSGWVEWGRVCDCGGTIPLGDAVTSQEDSPLVSAVASDWHFISSWLAKSCWSMVVRSDSVVMLAVVVVCVEVSIDS